MLGKPAKEVVFADEKLEKAFDSLSEEDWLKKAIKRAISDLKENSACGKHLKQELIPKEYVKKYQIDNLWWYPLPNGWRLVYSTIGQSEVDILAVIIDYLDHKNYERKFSN
ncbi:MAG: hypothetical protein NTX24_02140 [Candidatus Pacearchaeota archaeon]|nr:hypothetical protein [Candidatus Pacearchaeota archaeon]